jgi:hypothetical protein
MGEAYEHSKQNSNRRHWLKRRWIVWAARKTRSVLVRAKSLSIQDAAGNITPLPLPGFWYPARLMV